jgi:hypothetical protein
MLLHVQDAMISAYAGNDRSAHSPGVAFLGQEKPVIGSDAYRHIKINPSWFHDSFWHSISDEISNSVDHESWTQADLVYEHIGLLVAELGVGEADVVVALSDHQTDEEIGLLLGILKSRGLNPVGIVNSAVLECVDMAGGRPDCHLDIHLNQAIITEFTSDGPMKKASVQVLPGSGVMDFREQWSDRFAREFVETTRYDPHHSPSAEQEFFEQLLGNSHADQFPGSELTLHSADRLNKISIPVEKWISAGGSALDQLVQILSSYSRVAISAKSKGIPGLDAALAEVTEVVALHDGALTDAYSRYCDVIVTGAEQLYVIDELRPASGPGVGPELVTHLVKDGEAWPVGPDLSLVVQQGKITVSPGQHRDATVHVYRANDRVCMDVKPGHGAKVDGIECAQSAVLAPGSRITLAGCTGDVLAIREIPGVP